MLAADVGNHGNHGRTHSGQLFVADGARLQIESRQMQRGQQYQIAIIGERIALEEFPCIRNELIRIGRQCPLVEALRHGERLRVAQQNIQHAPRLDVPPGHQQTQRQGCGYDQADRAPQPTPEYRGNHHRERRKSRRVSVQLRLDQLRGEQLDDHEQPQCRPRHAPSGIDGSGEQH